MLTVQLSLFFFLALLLLKPRGLIRHSPLLSVTVCHSPMIKTHGIAVAATPSAPQPALRPDHESLINKPTKSRRFKPTA